MKRPIVPGTVILLLLLLAILIAGCETPTSPATTPAAIPIDSAPASQPSAVSKMYTNTEHGFSCEYPAEWELIDDLSEAEKSKGITVIFVGPKSEEYDHRAEIIIEADELRGEFTTEQYAEMVGEQILKNNVPDYNVIKEDIIIISGRSGIIRIFTATSDGLPLKYIQVYVMKGKICYALTYDVTIDLHDKFIDCYNLVINTFKID
jgi:hypothetical protein